ncbi:large proline-rich protein bag6 [Folsomia candida]|uniref:large proline-rich protein bag6 n=1 Tax=Folsomia candida TaxID=158441 RepID=UPI000B903D97|nr:large proline-rich protein bag6 [Folsomia candida]
MEGGAEIGGGGGSVVAPDDAVMTVTVKTLDSQNHHFTVAVNMLVKDFKIEITGKIGIPADMQRLIFRGRVLQDDKKMGECNVADSTIHVVQRSATSTRSNDEPPPVSAASRMPDGIQGGLIIAAQTGPLTNFGPRCSAAARLQASNHMLAQASTFLRRMEEEESINLGAAGADNENQVGGLPHDMEVEADDEFEEDVSGDSGHFNSMMSQVANATAASFAAGIRPPILNVGGGAGGPPAFLRNGQFGNVMGPIGQGQPTPAGSGTPNSGGSRTPTPQRRPESPRLQEMANVIEGIVNFNERLTPYLRYLETTLRSNSQYDNVEEQRSVQYLFDTVSTIMHFMSHSYHALSDMICDFSTPATTRRLRAATSVLLETSTVLRASIPIGVANAAVNMTPNVTVAGTNPDGTTQQPQNVTQQLPSQPPTTTGSSTAQAPNPQIGTQNLAHAVTQQISQMLGGARGPNGQFNFGNLGHGNFGAQIHVDIEPGDDGGHGAINIQDFAHMLGPMAGGMMMQQQQPNQNQPQPTVTTSTTPGTTSISSSSRNNNNSSNNGNRPGGGGGGASNNNGPNNFRLQQGGGPFDVLVPCNSHHGWRMHPSPRPSGFKQYVGDNCSRDVTPPRSSSSSSQEFLATTLNVLLQSNLVSFLRPAFQDVIVSYLMRGRDAKNKEHLKSCAKRLGRKITPFLDNFTNNVSNRDMTVDYGETYTSILTNFLAEVFHLTVTLPSSEPYQYQSALVTASDNLIRQIISIFKYCFKETPRHVDGFAEYIVEIAFSGCSLLLQDEIRTTLIQYFGLHHSASPDSSTRPNCITDKKPIPTPAVVASSSDATNAEPLASTSTNRPSGSIPKMSPEVVPPKQAKPSSPVPKSTDHVMEDDLDDFLDLNSIPRNPVLPNTPRGQQAGNLSPFDNALRNIPTEWVDTVRHDLTRQLGMPDQPPFSPAYSGIFSRKS